MPRFQIPILFERQIGRTACSHAFVLTGISRQRKWTIPRWGFESQSYLKGGTINWTACSNAFVLDRYSPAAKEDHSMQRFESRPFLEGGADRPDGMFEIFYPRPDIERVGATGFAARLFGARGFGCRLRKSCAQARQGGNFASAGCGACADDPFWVPKFGFPEKHPADRDSGGKGTRRRIGKGRPHECEDEAPENNRRPLNLRWTPIAALWLVEKWCAQTGCRSRDAVGFSRLFGRSTVHRPGL